jgi:RNA polymerase sigma-70 factor (ECF subfamily)
LRSVTVRKGLAHAKARKPHESLDGKVAALDGDPELAYMKKTYGDAFQRAFATALAALPAEQRLLLKQRFRHGMGVEDLGRQYGVNAGTITRRVQAARAELAEATRAHMMSSLGVGETDIASILRMIESQLEITLSTR